MAVVLPLAMSVQVILSFSVKVSGRTMRERAPAATRLEMRRLTVVRATGLDPVVRADGDVEHLLGVAVPEADEEGFLLVRGVEPAFIGGRDGLPVFLDGVERQQLSGHEPGAEEGASADERGHADARENRSCRVHPKFSENR